MKKIEERKREKEAAKAADQVFKAEANTVDDISKKKGKKKKGKKRKIEESEINEPVITETNENIKLNEVDIESEPKDFVQKDFKILGSKKRSKISSAKRVLPHWLSHPEIVSSELVKGPHLNQLENILDCKLIDKLKGDGFEQLFPVQARVLSWLLNCNEDYKVGRWLRDTCISMPTGSGMFSKQQHELYDSID